MRIVSTRRILLAAAAVGAFAHFAAAVDRTWSGASSNQFTATGNWTASIVPTSAEKAVFAAQAGLARSLVILNADRTVASMSIDGAPSVGAYEFQRQNNALLTITNGLQVGFSAGGASPNFNGFQVSAASLQVSGTAALNLTNSAVLTTSGQTSVQQTGVLNVTSSTVNATNLAIANSGVLNVNAAADVNVGNILQLTDTTSRININTGGAVAYVNDSFQAGTLTLNGTGTLTLNGSQLDTDGPAFIQFNRSFSLPAGKTLNIKQGGDLATTTFVDIATSGTGTFLVDGAGSSVNVGTDSVNGISSYWGLNNAATIAFSNSGTGDFNRGLIIGAGTGANTRLSITTGASLNVDSSLITGGVGGIASFTINAGTVTSTGTSAFGSGTTIDLQSGALILGGDATFSTGSTLNWTGGTFNLAAGKALRLAGGVIENTAAGTALPNGSRLDISAGGKFHGISFVDVANGNATGTLTVDGAGSEYTNAGSTPSDWGTNAGNSATVVFSNSAAGTISALRMSTSGGTSRLMLSSNAALTLGTLATGNGTLTPTVTITINGGALDTTGTASFLKGTTIALSSGRFALGGNTTFSTGASLNYTGGTFTAPSAIMSIEGGSLSLAAVDFSFSTDLRLSSGNLFFNDNARFYSGSSFNWTGGAWTLASSHTISFSGGAGTFNADLTLTNRAISITAGGSLVSNGYIDVARSNFATGTLIVDGMGSNYTLNNPGASYSDWALGSTNEASISFSFFAVGSLASGVAIGANGGAATVDINSHATLATSFLTAGNTAGTSSGGVNITLSDGTLNVATTATLASGATVQTGSGNFIVGGALNMSSDARILYTANAGRVLQIGSSTAGGTLNMSGTSKIDLSNGSMTIDYAGASPAATIAGYLLTGRDGGAWTGNGITSSLAASVAAASANTHKTGIGYTDTASSTLLTLAYAYLGDANLDRTVDTRDFAALVANFGLPTRQWYQGDFDYTGTVTSTDFTLLVSNYGLTLPSAAAEPILPGALVPEPSVFAALAATSLLIRRRRVGL